MDFIVSLFRSWIMLFVVIFFGGSVYLTPEPIDLHGRYEIVRVKPIEALTAGASLGIDVSSVIKDYGKGNDVWTLSRRVERLIPPGSVEAVLVGDGVEVVLRYKGHFRYNNTGIWVTLEADEGVPTGVDFTKVVIDSDVELKGVRVIWRNYQL